MTDRLKVVWKISCETCHEHKLVMTNSEERPDGGECPKCGGKNRVLMASLGQR